MIILLELKEKLKRFYNKYDAYIVPVMKFIVTLIAVLMLNSSIGYMSKLKNPVFALLIALLCAFLPNGAMVVILSVFMLVHLYAISAEFALIALCVIALMYLLYFRFTPKSGYLLVITAMLCWIKMPYLIPVAVGLCSTALAVIPVGFGIIIYFIIKTASEYEAAITGQSVSSSVQQITYVVEGMVKNKQMLVLLLAVSVTIIAVYVIRRLKVDYSWTYAVITGSIVQLIILMVGNIAFKASLNVVLIIIGTILGAVVGYICQVLFFSVDYKRTEYVQYEDDEYYYYVKAVPKINIAGADVRVKQINARKTKKTNDAKEFRPAHSNNNAAAEEDDDDFIVFDK